MRTQKSIKSIVDKSEKSVKIDESNRSKSPLSKGSDKKIVKGLASAVARRSQDNSSLNKPEEESATSVNKGSLAASIQKFNIIIPTITLKNEPEQSSRLIDEQDLQRGFTEGEERLKP
jgi:hypothetical protein